MRVIGPPEASVKRYLRFLFDAMWKRRPSHEIGEFRGDLPRKIRLARKIAARKAVNEFGTNLPDHAVSQNRRNPPIRFQPAVLFVMRMIYRKLVVFNGLYSSWGFLRRCL